MASRMIIGWKDCLEHLVYRQQDEFRPVVAGHLRLNLVPNLSLYFRTLRKLSDSLDSFASSKHRPENTIPELGGDTVVSVRKPMMVEVMFQQRSRQNRRVLMNAIVDK